LKSAIAAAAFAAVFACVSPALSLERPLDYERFELSESPAKEMWADMAADARGRRASAVVAKVDIGGGRTLSVSILQAVSLCGILECPLRVFEGDALLVSVRACDIPEEHGISEDGRVLRVCDKIINTRRR